MSAPVNVHLIDRAHAKLSASGSHRWLHCTASAWAESLFEDEGSEFAEEGTRAHGIGGDCLQQGINAAEWRDAKIAAMPDADSLAQFEEQHPDEMFDFVQDYLNYVREEIDAARAQNPDAIIIIEQRVDFSKWVPEGFGTADCIIICDGVIRVIDFKYGKGVFVAVLDNEQLLLYGAGAWNMFQHLFTADVMQLHLFQPRIGNVASWEISEDMLLNWLEYHVKPVAEKVWHALQTGDLSDVEFKPDAEVCRFCKAKVHCRARKERMVAMASYNFVAPALLTDQEVVECLDEAEHLGKWANDLKAWALKKAETGSVLTDSRGKQIRKLVEGRSTRRYTDERAVRATLLLEGFTPALIYKSKLLGITDMTALLHGKKALDSILGPFITKPRGKPVLVPMDDPRDEIDDRASGFEAQE